MDRLTRQGLEDAIPLFIDLLKSGIELVTLQDNQHYTKDSLRDLAKFITAIILLSGGNRESERAGIEPSVGSKGDSYDNALAETINGLYKAELIHRRAPWKTVESLELATLEWVTWFNHQRLLEPIGYIPPAEAEDQYYLQLTMQADHACT